MVSGKEKLNEINERPIFLRFPSRAHIFLAMSSKDFSEDDLNPKQRLFCLEYMKDLNGTQAAIRAGYSEKTARNIASENLAKPYIMEFIAKLQAERAQSVKIDAQWLLDRLAREAEADERDLYDEHGNFLPVSEWPLVWRQGLVTGIESEGAAITDPFSGEKVIKSRVSKVKLADRARRLEMIGRHIGVQAFRDNVALSSPSGGPVEIDLTVSPKEAAERWRRQAEDGK